MVFHAVMKLKASKMAQICHMFSFRLRKVKILSKKLSGKDSPQNVDKRVDDPV